METDLAKSQRQKLHEFIRVELYKDRILNGQRQIDQCEEMHVKPYTLQQVNSGYYLNSPLMKVLSYLLTKNIIQLCPQKKERFLSS